MLGPGLAVCNALALSDQNLGSKRIEDLMKIQVSTTSRSESLRDEVPTAIYVPTGVRSRSGFSAIPEIVRLVPAISATSAYARTEDRALSEYAIKAQFLCNFLRFIEWPSTRTSPMTVGVIGRDPFGKLLDEALDGKTINGRKLVVRRVTWAEAADVQLLFVSASESEHMESVSKLGQRSVVTVGESAGFASKGGMIGFVLVDGRIGFEINPRVARTAGVSISSKLLQLAKIVGK
jgi:hypothetical protein